MKLLSLSHVLLFTTIYCTCAGTEKTDVEKGTNLRHSHALNSNVDLVNDPKDPNNSQDADQDETPKYGMSIDSFKRMLGWSVCGDDCKTDWDCSGSCPRCSYHFKICKERKCKWWDGCKYCTRQGGGWDLEYCNYDDRYFGWNNDYRNNRYGNNRYGNNRYGNNLYGG